MDTFFVSHGSPTLAIDDSFQARSFLQSWREKVMGGHAPKAILMVSGHWDTSSPHVNAVSGPCDTIHDFYGFPKHMYKLKYPAHGAPWVATRVKELLDTAGFGPVKVDPKRGLDHGAWVPLMLMYPEADVPICQLSVESSKDGTYHYNLGKALVPLKDEGILVIGSGSATHNLRSAQPDGTPIAHWALEFDKWLKDAVLGGKIDELNDFQKKAPYAKMAHPWPDHFYPLHVALGAAGSEAKAELIHDSWSNGTFSYATFRFSDAGR